MNKKLLFVLVLILGCNDDADHCKCPAPDEDFLIFGRSFGFCQGETCAEFFLLKDGGLLESNDELGYMVQPGEPFPAAFFTFDRSDHYDDAKRLLEQFPAELFDEPDNVIGCPDCSDGGAAYLEIKVKGEYRAWIIDLQRPPEYLEDYLKELASVVLAMQ